ncbi:MAG: hypothetical protein AAFX87_18305 [Bacteroidota bacterium]
MRKTFSIVCLCAVLCSCAASYKPITPTNLSYEQSSNNDSFNYSYRYDVLAEAGNKKYVKKAKKKGVQVIAVKIENNTGKTIYPRDDMEFYLGSQRVFPLDPQVTQQQIKQPAPLYLLWGLLWVFINNCDNGDCSSTPLPVGFGIGLINLGIAGSANKQLLMELSTNNILDKQIADGETAYGLIGLSSFSGGNFKIQLKD